MSWSGGCSKPTDPARPVAPIGAAGAAGSQRPTAALRLARTDRPEAAPSPFSLVDLQARTVRYLRISVTDRCNYRCTYCMPEQGVDVVPRTDLLDFAEIERLARLFVDLGIRAIRITGGEPLVRRGIVELVERLARIQGLDDLAMTTNGHQLAELAGPLHAAGLRRLNVSVDTLDAARFSQLTRRGDLDTVLRGLDAARAVGFRHTKLNAVVLRGLNDQELPELADFAAEQGVVLRLIEYMPIGLDGYWGPETYVPAAEMRARLATAWELAPDASHGLPGGGPATYWRGTRKTDGREVRLGFIAAVSEGFCRLCNRVRLSPTGTLRECLSTGGVLSLRDLLRQGASDDTVRAAIRAALLGKVAGHRFDASVQTFEPMSAIGG